MASTDRPPHGPRRESNNTLYFIVGALVVAVLVIAWFLYGGDETATDNVDVNVESSEPATTLPDATEAPATTPEPELAEPEPEPVTPPAAEPAPAEPAEPAAPPAPAEPAAPEGTTPQ